ncbi:MAG: DUF3810 domain-containing protein [Oscillospiraceae bacterium]|nr:DUF3810 domain-containing protein [Oscillospiraceae bacterium]
MKTIGRLILSAIFFILTGLLLSAASTAPQLVFSFYPNLIASVLDAISSVTAQLPFALWEVLALLAVLWLIYSLVRSFSRGRGFFYWAAGVVLFASVLAFSFTALWGLYHYDADVSEKLQLEVRQYSVQELKQATEYYAEQANALSKEVVRPDGGVADFSEFESLAAKAASGFDVLGETYALFADADGSVKKLAAWPLYSSFGTTGIFVPFTAEASVNPDTYEVWLPFTMCHEISHRQGVAAENGANFCAYLACMANPDAEYRYSGAFAAFTYCSNALSRVDADAAAQIWKNIDAGVYADAMAANEHYAKYEGKVQDTAQKVNDAYLKAFGEESGVQSYGECADLLIAWYLQNSSL